MEQITANVLRLNKAGGQWRAEIYESGLIYYCYYGELEGTELTDLTIETFLTETEK